MPSNSLSKVLVTGGAGFFGSHICEQLLLDGKQVIIVDVFNDETSSAYEKRNYIEYLIDLSNKIKDSQLTVYDFDILEEGRLCELLKKEKPVSCVHAAALVMDRKSVQKPIQYIINNIQGTQHLLNAIRRTDTIKHLVLISSRSAVGETFSFDDKMSENDLLRPINPYGATKAAAEDLCFAFHKNFGISVSICRMWPMYGSRCRRDMMPRLLFESALFGKAVDKYGTGEAIRDWLYVEDGALGVLAALKHPDNYSIFHFGTGIATTLNELIQMVSEISGKKLNLNYKDIPRGDAVYAGLCNYQKAKKVLGWEPKVDLRTGFNMMYQYMLSTRT